MIFASFFVLFSFGGRHFVTAHVAVTYLNMYSAVCCLSLECSDKTLYLVKEIHADWYTFLHEISKDALIYSIHLLFGFW